MALAALVRDMEHAMLVASSPADALAILNRVSERAETLYRTFQLRLRSIIRPMRNVTAQNKWLLRRQLDNVQRSNELAFKARKTHIQRFIDPLSFAWR